jgi:hypothetical protein
MNFSRAASSVVRSVIWPLSADTRRRPTVVEHDGAVVQPHPEGPSLPLIFSARVINAVDRRSSRDAGRR